MQDTPYTLTPKALLYIGIYENLERMLSEQKQAVCKVLGHARNSLLNGDPNTAAEELADLLCLLGVDGIGVERVNG